MSSSSESRSGSSCSSISIEQAIAGNYLDIDDMLVETNEKLNLLVKEEDTKTHWNVKFNKTRNSSSWEEISRTDQSIATKKRVYKSLRSKYQKEAGFYIDVATSVMSNESHYQFAAQALSTIAEKGLEDAHELRIIARILLGLKGYLEYAIRVYTKILSLRPEEPQSYRDLALAIMKRPSKTIDDYEQAMSLLSKILTGDWDKRFAQIELVALMDANAIIQEIHYENLVDKVRFECVDARLIKPMDVDIRIVLQWHQDDTDVELHVTEPDGTVCNAFNNKTQNGGLHSRDFTAGFGPVEYLIHTAQPGDYKIKARVFHTQHSKSATGTLVTMTVYTNFGRPNVQISEHFSRISTVKDFIDMGVVTYKP